ncbi:MAG TPA: aminotransferase class III-fold pyridoxal phosphate-dependent enzyme [Nitrospirae bacterium]|nr:3-aminobutyryl-CoA aminotransferase [bacterium BMS3Abin06]HDH11416.1 aminotransferase class III-fold pyridoxal phosphate-dependent enzyme [Nitrospirota bacterium]HDZ01430.1 aminotransferase class III-fold pyridoxal phosphate-dependent enzyme [Nitrospirota bacterium]
MNCHTGIDLYKRAKKIIPGGTQLLSKRPELFLPGQWPAYYSKCNGVEVSDLDGNEFIDMSICGVGACILGYADPDVDRAVKNAIDSGTMCTLNCPEEVELAELLCELHPWADMVRFARGGGEAMSVAVRIARAATGRDRVAFCGYHGWHDWYLAANLADDSNLDGQLLPGLAPAGIPRSLQATAIPFNYNQPESLDAIVDEDEQKPAAIVMEPVRHSEPEAGFLEYVRETADRTGAVLIFDEVTSGWRMNNGGIHLLYGVNPDIAVFAKGISNGYPMAALIGCSPVMEAAQRSFISSTYWTEKIGPAAALATIRKMMSCNVPEYLNRTGISIRKIWRDNARKYGIKAMIHGIPPLSVLSFKYEDMSQALHTLFTQEMLNRGFLASKAFYATYVHNEEHINAYEKAVEEVFKIIADTINENSPDVYLKGPVAHNGFKRLA